MHHLLAQTISPLKMLATSSFMVVEIKFSLRFLTTQVLTETVKGIFLMIVDPILVREVMSVN